MRQRVLWTIGDSIFRINRDMVCDIASAVHCASVTSDFTGASISPCRMPEQCMVNLIKDGAFDRLFAGAIKPDIILVQRGVNDLYEYDVNGMITMGDPDSVDEATSLLGAVNYCAGYFAKRFPFAKVVWCSPVWSAATGEKAFNEYREKLAGLCAIRKIMFLDVYKASGIDKTNQKEFLYDGTHPNESGKQRLTEIFSNALRGVV